MFSHQIIVIIVTIFILCVGKTDGSRVLLLCLIFGLHHEDEAAGLGDENEDFYHDACHDACLEEENVCHKENSCIDNEYVCDED